ncbi:hypothetical protein PFBG_06066, partial [Plasmodium falciparum 7G8]
MNDHHKLITDASKQCICVHLQHNVVGKHTKMAPGDPQGGGSGGAHGSGDAEKYKNATNVKDLAPGDPQGGGSGGAHGSGDAEKYKNATNVKDLLDMIGADVYNEVKSEANQYKEALTGQLSLASIWKESASTTEPCKLINDEGQKLIHARGDPCGNTTGKDEVPRFSKERVAEYDEKKIRGNKGKGGNNEGECAPYRRLSLCNKNMEKKGTTKITDKNDLLADVCMAANFEGESIKTHYKQYEVQYPGSGHTTCTMLARSFADIGDIIRGKDLYGRNNRKRKQLEENLQKYFENIYYGLSNETNAKELQERYKDDTPDFFKLREDWWSLNRETVWKAMTCSADRGNAYFRATCGDEKKATLADVQCRCTKPNADQVPTSFDYVPQFLRWFEEWAEDFCRKRKYKLKDAIKKCREGEDQSGDDRYCSGNGYDCKGTFRAKNKYRWDYKCAGCFLSCSDFRKWIDNQRKEFDKQKNKYDKEIEKANGTSNGTTIRTQYGTINNLYVGDFYSKLQQSYGSVNQFLQKLNDETTCKEHPEVEVKGVKADHVDFTKQAYTTFSRTEICEPCPWCGVKKQNETWERINDHSACEKEELYTPKKNATSTKINVLTSGEGHEDIAKRLKEFCTKTQNGGDGGGGGGVVGNSEKKELIEKWQCYEFKDLQKDGQDVGKDDKLKGAGGLCILEKTNSEENGKKQKTFNNFFNFWVAHVLKDSIEWREKLGKCLENGTKTCKNKQCRKNCECYESWIQQKEDEWKLIEQHYEKEDFHDWDPYWALEYNLQDDYFPSIQKAYPRVKFVEEIEQIIDENKANISNCTKDNNSITKLLKKEEVIATNCLQKCQETQKPPAGGDAGGRSLTPAGGATDSGGGHSSEDVEDEEDDDDDDDEDGDENEEDEDKDEVAVEGEDTDGESGPKVVEPEVTKVDGVKPACDIVAELFEKPKDFKEVACKQKYGLPQRYWGWKCIPSGDNSTTREGSESAGRSRRDTGSSGKPTSDKGSICVPPRRRRLYVKKLHNWATALPQGEGAASTETPQVALLRDAFIQSAAIETFFLWDRYKKIKEKERQEKEKREREERALLLPFASQASGIQVLDQNRVAPQLPPSLPASLGQAQPTPLTQQPVASSDGDPPTSLQKGHIPPDFLRQMFYTLADYRDILVRGGGNNTNISGSSDKDRPSSNNNNIVLLASENRGEMEKIQEQLKVFFSNSGNQSSTGGRNPLQNGDTSPQNSDKRQTLWQNIAKDIWNAMVCALTYKDNTNGGPPTQDEEVKKALLDNDGKPQNSDYTYDKVELKDNDENGGPSPKPQSTSTSGDNTPLTQFVERPPYFRYLEEWGETFCRQRTRMLKNVKKACREKHDGGDTFCSGDGHDCTDVERRYNNMFADINCRDCYEQCRKYRKWIDMKFEEFQKQKDKYKGELDKLTKDKSGGGDNNCCKEIKNHSSAADFLKSLRHCKDDEVHEEKGDEYQKNKIDFKNITQTFSPSTYCKVCPLYGVNCNANKRGKSGTNGCTTNTEPTNQKSAEGVATPITILINDGATDGSTDVTDKQLEEKCKEYGLYKDLRKQEWNCEHNNNIYKCELQKPLNSEYYDDKIPFNILFQRWLIDFIQYYNKSKERITRCTNNVTSCKEGCNNKCNCVKKWLEKKEQEWNIIKKYYKERLQSDDERIASRIKSFFEQGTFPSDVTKAKKVVKCKDEQDKLWGCTGETECKNEQEEKEHADFITNLISKLKEKISECTSQPSDKTQANCGEYTPPDDEDLLLEEEYPENTLEQPKFCPTPTQPPEEKGGET